MKHSEEYLQAQAIEELAKEFFNARSANFTVGSKAASLWIADPQQGHYLDAHDAARFYNWATDMVRVRSLNIKAYLLAKLVQR